MRPFIVLLLCLLSSWCWAEEDLDAELDQEWGHKKIEAKQAEAPNQVYKAKLAMLITNREGALSRCRNSRDRYCRKYAEEQFRRDKRALDKEFELLSTDEKVENKDVRRKVFDRQD